MPRKKTKPSEDQEFHEVPKPQKEKGIKLNKEQQQALETINAFDVTFIEGKWGCGKTMLAVYAAIQHLKRGFCEKIVVTRPFIADKGLGALPGSASEKINFEMQPILDNFYELIGQNETEKLISDGIIKLQYSGKVKGITVQDAIFLCDETQDNTWQDFIRLLTRLGSRSKMICTLSKEQIHDFIGDDSCYYDLLWLKDSGLVGWSQLVQNHRHGLINQIIDFVEEKRNGD